jgi:hypothetical protein
MPTLATPTLTESEVREFLQTKKYDAIWNRMPGKFKKAIRATSHRMDNWTLNLPTSREQIGLLEKWYTDNGKDHFYSLTVWENGRESFHTFNQEVHAEWYFRWLVESFREGFIYYDEKTGLYAATTQISNAV